MFAKLGILFGKNKSIFSCFFHANNNVFTFNDLCVCCRTHSVYPLLQFCKYLYVNVLYI